MLAEEAHGLPAESEVLHTNYERYEKPTLIMFDINRYDSVFFLPQVTLIIHEQAPEVDEAWK